MLTQRALAAISAKGARATGTLKGDAIGNDHDCTRHEGTVTFTTGCASISIRSLDAALLSGRGPTLHASIRRFRSSGTPIHVADHVHSQNGQLGWSPEIGYVRVSIGVQAKSGEVRNGGS